VTCLLPPLRGLNSLTRLAFSLETSRVLPKLVSCDVLTVASGRRDPTRSRGA
jgi:hypothetical protein